MAVVERVFVTAGMADLAAADGAFDLLCSLAGPAQLDVVTIGRKHSGEVRLHAESRESGPGAEGPGAAAGLAAALYPSVGADQPAHRAADRAALSAVAGRVTDVVGRAALREMGELLDASPAAVIVVCGVEQHGTVLRTLSDAGATAVSTRAALDETTLAPPVTP